MGEEKIEYLGLHFAQQKTISVQLECKFLEPSVHWGGFFPYAPTVSEKQEIIGKKLLRN